MSWLRMTKTDMIEQLSENVSILLRIKWVLKITKIYSLNIKFSDNIITIVARHVIPGSINPSIFLALMLWCDMSHVMETVCVEVTMLTILAFLVLTKIAWEDTCDAYYSIRAMRYRMWRHVKRYWRDYQICPFRN